MKKYVYTRWYNESELDKLLEFFDNHQEMHVINIVLSDIESYDESITTSYQAFYYIEEDD